MIEVKITFEVGFLLVLLQRRFGSLKLGETRRHLLHLIKDLINQSAKSIDYWPLTWLHCAEFYRTESTWCGRGREASTRGSLVRNNGWVSFGQWSVKWGNYEQEKEGDTRKKLKRDNEEERRGGKEKCEGKWRRRAHAVYKTFWNVRNVLEI